MSKMIDIELDEFHFTWLKNVFYFLLCICDWKKKQDWNGILYKSSILCIRLCIVDWMLYHLQLQIAHSAPSLLTNDRKHFNQPLFDWMSSKITFPITNTILTMFTKHNKKMKINWTFYPQKIDWLCNFVIIFRCIRPFEFIFFGSWYRILHHSLCFYKSFSHYYTISK